MITGFFLGAISVAVVFYFSFRAMCGHHNTTHVTKCKDCGHVFNDSIEELRSAAIVSDALTEITKPAMETYVRNQETLVAKFILENPELKAHEIEIVQIMDGAKFVTTVRRRKLVPEGFKEIL